MPELTIPAIDPTIAIVLGIGAAFASILLFVGAVSTALVERRQVYRTLRGVRSVDVSNSRDIARRDLARPVTGRLLVPLMRRLTALGRRLTPISVIERLDQELQYAGSPRSWDAGRVLAFKIITPPAMVALALALSPLIGLSAIQVTTFAIIFGVAGWYMPEWVVRSAAQKRQHKIQRALPDALDLLSITVEAGLGFDAALSRVSREIEGPVGEEFFRVVQEIQLGEDRIEALRGLAERNKVAELKSFVLAMIQASQLGIAISNVLQVQADEMRLKRRQRAEEKAQKLPVKIVFPLIFCIFPALFVVLLGPAAITIYETIFQVF